MHNATSETLSALYTKTHNLLRCYHDKDQWPNTYPLLNKLAGEFYSLYQTHPNALQAQITLYITRFGYTTNLVITQCVIITALCKALNYSEHVSKQLISVCLTNYLCVQVQTNKLANQQPLEPQEKKQWQLRHQLAIKLLQTAEQSISHITRILAPLNKYKQALLSSPKVMIYDGATTLVALTNIIAMNISYRDENDHVDIYKAIADLYIRTPNNFAQTALKSLVNELGPYLPASSLTISEQKLVYVGKGINNKCLVVDLDDDRKVRWHSVSANIVCDAKQRPSRDKRLIFGLWFSENLALPVINDLDSQQQILFLISQLKVQKEYSYRGLAQLLGDHDETINDLREAVRPYNKEQLAGKDLRHSLSMIGMDNAPAIIQRVLFQRLVKIQHHPLKQHIHTRLHAHIQVLALLVSKQPTIQFEQVALPLYAYIHYLFTNCGDELSRKTLYKKDSQDDKALPLSRLFGVEHHDDVKLQSTVISLLADNPWTQPLIDAEQITKPVLSFESSLWVALKLIILNLYRPDITMTLWQSNILDSVIKKLNWQSREKFYAKLPDLNLSSSV